MRGGQAAVEYVLVFAAFVVLATVLGYFVVATQRYADRAERLVRSDYP